MLCKYELASAQKATMIQTLFLSAFASVPASAAAASNSACRDSLNLLWLRTDTVQQQKQDKTFSSVLYLS